MQWSYRARKYSEWQSVTELRVVCAVARQWWHQHTGHMVTSWYVRTRHGRSKAQTLRFVNLEAVLCVVKTCGNISVALCPCSWTHSGHPHLRPSSLLVTQIMPSPLFQLFTATLYAGSWEVLPLFHISIPHSITALARSTVNKSNNTVGSHFMIGLRSQTFGCKSNHRKTSTI